MNALQKINISQIIVEKQLKKSISRIAINQEDPRINLELTNGYIVYI
ncbi:MAG: hypothetical protein JXA99_06530 [Candidatus Lokiarchaeota archaeon]|nr:hypothetical protein [Candidatus Lokiarchaeota archaeon]